MQGIDIKYVRQLNDILWEFLWSGKKYHVAKEICTLPQTFGGLNMVDLHNQSETNTMDFKNSESWANWKLGITAISIH